MDGMKRTFSETYHFVPFEIAALPMLPPCLPASSAGRDNGEVAAVIDLPMFIPAHAIIPLQSNGSPR